MPPHPPPLPADVHARIAAHLPPSTTLFAACVDDAGPGLVVGLCRCSPCAAWTGGAGGARPRQAVVVHGRRRVTAAAVVVYVGDDGVGWHAVEDDAFLGEVKHVVGRLAAALGGGGRARWMAVRAVWGEGAVVRAIRGGAVGTARWLVQECCWSVRGPRWEPVAAVAVVAGGEAVRAVCERFGVGGVVEGRCLELGCARGDGRAVEALLDGVVVGGGPGWREDMGRVFLQRALRACFWPPASVWFCKDDAEEDSLYFSRGARCGSSWGRRMIGTGARVAGVEGIERCVRAVLGAGGVVEPAMVLAAAEEGWSVVLEILLASETGDGEVRGILRVCQGLDTLKAALRFLERSLGIAELDKEVAGATVAAVMMGEVRLARFLLDRRRRCVDLITADDKLCGEVLLGIAGKVGRGARDDGEWLAVARLFMASVVLKVGITEAGAWLAKVSPAIVHTASLACDPSFLRLLVHLGADVNALDGDGLTPLCVAVAHRGARTCLETLLLAGADVFARDPRGRTPLHIAAEANNGAGSAVLLRAGADPLAADRCMVKPVDLDPKLEQRVLTYAWRQLGEEFAKRMRRREAEAKEVEAREVASEFPRNYSTTLLFTSRWRSTTGSVSTPDLTSLLCETSSCGSVRDEEEEVDLGSSVDIVAENSWEAGSCSILAGQEAETGQLDVESEMAGVGEASEAEEGNGVG